MGLVNNGGQILVFDYKQEGKSEGFNKILYNLIPKGIVKGGTLIKSTDSSVTISPFLCFFEDTEKKIGIRIETTTTATSDISLSKPYIIGRFSWLNLEDNYMDIISAGSTDITDTDLILGRGIFEASTLTGFDYSKKSWSKNFYDNNIDFEPSFLVVPNEPYDNKLKVGKGSAYINGKKVVFDSEKQTPAFDLSVTNGRKDLVVVNDDATITIIKGTDSADPLTPLFPNKGLVVAVVTLPPNPTSVNGGFVEYIYNNNYYSPQSEDVIDKATSSPTGNTLMKRDTNGRSQVTSPSADNDIANKAYVDDEISSNISSVQGDLTTHINTTTGVHGATSSATASKIIIRDSAGRAQVANPSANNDIANKAYVDSKASGDAGAVQTNLTAHINKTTGVHGAVSTATANKIAIRDGSGRLKVNDPSDGLDAVNRQTVVSLINDIAIQAWTNIKLNLFIINLMSVTFGNGKFVAVGSNGKGAYSTDGVTWTAINDTKFGSTTANAVTYGNGKFVAVGKSGQGAYSTDGVTWTAINDTKFGSTDIISIAFGNGTFVAIGSSSGAYSTDGVTWTRLSGMLGYISYYSVNYCKDKFIIFGYGTSQAIGGEGKRILYSTNGVIWTTRLISVNVNYLYSVTFGNGKFVAVGSNGQGAYSTDGVTWTKMDIASLTIPVRYITYGNGTFVAVGSDGSNGKGAYSTDGVTWTAINDIGFNDTISRSLAYGNGRFVVVGDTGTFSASLKLRS